MELLCRRIRCVLSRTGDVAGCDISAYPHDRLERPNGYPILQSSVHMRRTSVKVMDNHYVCMAIHALRMQRVWGGVYRPEGIANAL